jgi:hypothetical protein
MARIDNSTMMMLYLASIVVGAIVGLIVYKDARGRGMSLAGLWGVLSFLLFPIVPLIYLFARRGAR